LTFIRVAEFMAEKLFKLAELLFEAEFEPEGAALRRLFKRV
jgi:hypothetical protein